LIAFAELAGLANGGNALYSGEGLVPFAGWAASAGKGARYTAKAIDSAGTAAKYSDELIDAGRYAAKYADEAADAVKYADEAVDAVQYADEAADGAKHFSNALTEAAGDYNSLVEKAKNADIWTSAHQAVFYSGEGNRARAEAFARLNGKTTLEMTPGGKYFDSLKLFEDGSPVTKDQAYEIWEILSERYAKAASGNVYGFVKGANPGSIFNTKEYPALQKNRT